MGRGKPSYPRTQFREGFRAWLVAHKAIALGSVAGVAVVLVLSTVLAARVEGPDDFTWWLLGAVQVFVIGASYHLLRDAYLAHDGWAVRNVRGWWGEDNTRSELAIARRRRLVWGSVHSISLERGDLDHVTVLRRGGALVLDSKWRTELVDVDDIVRGARRARTRAEGVLRTIERRGAQGRSPSRLPVTATVVVWGPAQHDLGRPRVVDGVTLVPGRQLRPWLRQLDGDPVPRAVARELLARLDEYGAGTRRARATATPQWARLSPGASAPSAR